MEDCQTSLRDETVNALQTYVMAKYEMLAGAVYNQIANRTKGGIPADFDARQWVREAYRKALDKIDALPDDAEAHAKFLETWRGPRYFVMVAANAATDDYTSHKDELLILAELEEREPRADPQSVEDDALERVAHEGQRDALWTIVRTLVWRSGSSGATSMTQQQFDTLRAYGDVQRSTDSDGPGDDATLHAEAIKHNQRAREAWARERATVRAGGTVVHRNGLRTATAQALKIAPATVTMHLNDAARAVRFTRYVAGVLAHRRALQHPACVARHLNVADALVAAGYRAQHKLLSVAANHVHTTEQNGTRVDSMSYGEAGASTVDDLHGAESVYADRANAAWPNCVAVCADHTLNGRTNRTTEF